MSLAGRVAVVTGGARGIGRALVEGFLREGSRVVAVDCSWNDEEEFRDSVASNSQALVLTVDVAEEGQIAEAARTTFEQFGVVDILVNNAAYRQRDIVPWMVTRVLDVSADHWQKSFQVNTLAPLFMVKHFIGPMKGKQACSIIQISSDSGVKGVFGNQPYGATKAALTNWSQSLAEELRDDNIAVNCIFPAATKTTGYDEQMKSAAEHLGRPIGRFVPYKPDSVVPLVLFLAQQDARVTGRCFPVVDWNLEHGLGGIERWAAFEPDTPEALIQYEHPVFLR